jgi:signal transduction histidine kinase
MAWRQQWNPRLHFAAAIGWAVFAVVTLAALVTANVAATEAEARARADTEGLLDEFATQVRDALSMHLETRRSLLEATAAQIAAGGDAAPVVLQRTLEAVQARFPEFTWLCVADAQGRVLARVGDGPGTDDVSALPWFNPGRQRALVIDQALPASLPGQDREVDAAVPLGRTGVETTGVLAGRLSWPWVEQRLAKMQNALGTHRQLQLMVVARDHTVIAGPAGWPGRQVAAEPDVSEGGAYVAGSRTSLRLADNLGLGWTAVVRQRADLALAPVVSTRRTVFLTVFLAGLLSAAAAVVATRVLTRRLSLLAQEAEAVRKGDQAGLALPAGADEVSRIGATLAEVVAHLQHEKQALQTLNVELDARVAERTARIERMADEARHAAVTRERLRIARDLHDTLAHSLMALLTQIRLVRKLRSRLDAAELDAELERAEGVAASGLAGARSAITQMRGNGVRESGLGPALQDLLRRLGERSGASTTFEADPRAAAWAGERSETVFRIVEEALRNAERHAAAAQVTLRLAWQETPAPRLRVEIADDGVGFDPARPRPGHYGLLGVQEQAALIEARLQLHSRPGQGTRIELVCDA